MYSRAVRVMHLSICHRQKLYYKYDLYIYIYVGQVEKVVCIKSKTLNVNCNKTILLLWCKCYKFYAVVKCHVFSSGENVVL